MAATSIQIDTGKLSRLIGLGYEASLTRTAWREFVDTIAAVSGSPLAMLQYIDDDHPERSFLACGGLGEDFERLFTKVRWQSEDDQFWTAIRNSPSGTVRLGQEIMVREVMHRSPAYHLVAKPWNLEHFLISAVTTGSGVSAYLSLGRTAKQSPFVEGDKMLFNQMVLSHLQRSFVLYRALGATRQTNALLTAVFDTAPYGMVLFDTRGRPRAVNQVASAIFEAAAGLTLINGRLHASDPVAHARLEDALSMALHSALGASVGPPDAVVVPRRNHKHPYHVVFSRIRLREITDGFPTGTAVGALIHEGWLTDTVYMPTLLRSTYGLTRAEIRLCQAMLEGKSLSEAAEALAISRNTAKTHLARVFNKSGVTSQAALLRLLAQGTQGPGPRITNP